MLLGGAIFFLSRTVVAWPLASLLAVGSVTGLLASIHFSHSVVDLRYSWEKHKTKRERIVKAIELIGAALVGGILTQVGRLLVEKLRK